MTFPELDKIPNSQLGATPMSTENQPEAKPADIKPIEPFELDLNDDTPLPKICDLSGDGTCESCQ